MDIQTLRFFKTIADTGSFCAASESLHYAQSNLSTQIKALELELGSQLFVRGKKGTTLTIKGQILYEYANKIISLTDEVVTMMTDTDHPRGNLRLGSIEAVEIKFLPAFLKEYHQKCPDVKLAIKTEMNDWFLKPVLNYELDGAFVSGPVCHPELKEVTLYQVEPVLFGSANEEVSDAKTILQNSNLLTFPEGAVFRRMMEQLMMSYSVAVHTDRFTVLDSLYNIISSAAAGIGFGYLPFDVIKDHIDNGALRTYPIDEHAIQTDIVFIYRKDHIKDAAFKELIQLLESYTKAH